MKGFRNITTGLKVNNQSVGIAPEHFSQFFNCYFQIDEKKYQTSGLGLSLYTTAEIITLHGGEISIKSEPGRILAIWFTIPEQFVMFINKN